MGLRDWHAMSNALTTKLLSKLEENAQPNTRLENTFLLIRQHLTGYSRSSTAARYNQPSVVGKYVMSESHI